LKPAGKYKLQDAIGLKEQKSRWNSYLVIKQIIKNNLTKTKFGF
jgi:hypothetical protein